MAGSEECCNSAPLAAPWERRGGYARNRLTTVFVVAMQAAMRRAHPHTPGNREHETGGLATTRLPVCFPGVVAPDGRKPLPGAGGTDPAGAAPSDLQGSL